MDLPQPALRHRAVTTQLDFQTAASSLPSSPTRPPLSRATTGDSTPSFELSDEDLLFSGLSLLDLLVLLDAHLELWTRGLRRKSVHLKSKAEQFVEESKARAQKIKLPKVNSEQFLNRLAEDNVVLSVKDRERLERRYKEVRHKTVENMRKLSQKWEEE
jgi:hypothetical protein